MQTAYYVVKIGFYVSLDVKLVKQLRVKSIALRGNILGGIICAIGYSEIYLYMKNGSEMGRIQESNTAGRSGTSSLDGHWCTVERVRRFILIFRNIQ
jgi:hypothetical protein